MARGYYVRLYYVGLDSAEECIQRVANRVSRGGHDISADIVRHRFAARWASLAAVLPYCNTAVFFDKDNGFVQVAEWRNMELLPKGDLRPRWLEDLLAYMVENPI